MDEELEFVAEQDLLIWRSPEDQIRFTMRVSRPVLVQHHPAIPQGPVWLCFPRLDGLINLSRPTFGVTSFQALTLAIQACRQLIRDSLEGGKIYLIGGMWGEEIHKDRIVSLKDIFGMY